MGWHFLNIFRQDRKAAHEQLFDLDQGVIAERRGAEAMKELALIARQNLDLLHQVEQEARQYEEQGSEIMAEAAKAYLEGITTLVSTPLQQYQPDREARQVSMRAPF